MKPRHPSWIYWDKNAKRVRIHLTKRGACQDGYGAHTDDREFGIAYGWQGANSYARRLNLPGKSSVNFAVTTPSTARCATPEQLELCIERDNNY
jgi:hypothetical protein